MNSMDATVTQDRVESPPSRTSQSPRAIAFMNQKGGVGKTTTTVNLGAAFAQQGKRVLLVDLDPQAHLTLHLGVELADEQPSAYDLLIDLRMPFERVVVHRSDNLHVVPSETDLAAAELELSARPGREFILGNKLRQHLANYDLILFDCPPSLGILTLNALATAKEVFVPMQAHFLPLQGVGKLLETVSLVTENVNDDLRVTAIVLCAHENQTTLSREIVADLQQFFDSSRNQEVAWRDCRILEPPVRRNIKLAEAPSFGQTIFEYANDCNGSEDYRALASRLLADWWPEEFTAVHQPASSKSVDDEVVEENLPDECSEELVGEFGKEIASSVTRGHSIESIGVSETTAVSAPNIQAESQVEVKPEAFDDDEADVPQIEVTDEGHSWARPWDSYSRS